MVELTGRLELIPPMALATFTSALLTCVSPRSKYNKGVQIQADDHSDRSRRRNAHSIIRSIGRLFRGNKAAAQDQPVTDWTSETIEVPGDEQQGGSLRPEVVVSPPLPPPRVRIHHHVVYEAVPRTPPPCLAYKFGAPDGIDRRDVEEIFEPRDPSFREMASYGDTYVLPAPSVESMEGD
ncbi:hypothetical protein V3C99_000240 [Haemonchus contortus]